MFNTFRNYLHSSCFRYFLINISRRWWGQIASNTKWPHLFICYIKQKTLSQKDIVKKLFVQIFIFLIKYFHQLQLEIFDRLEFMQEGEWSFFGHLSLTSNKGKSGSETSTKGMQQFEAFISKKDILFVLCQFNIDRLLMLQMLFFLS